MTGLAVLTIAVWTILDKYQYFTLLTTFIYPLLTYFLLAAGGLVLLVAILGFCAGCWEHRPLLLCVNINCCSDEFKMLILIKIFLLQYVFLLILIFLIEAMVGVLGFLYQESVHTELENNLNSTFLTTYNIDEDKTLAINNLQEKVIIQITFFYS